MCGIAGIRRYGDEPINPTQLHLLLTGLESRGNDASGIVLQQEDGSLAVYKDDVPAWSFVSSQEYKLFLEEHLKPSTVAALLHTRYATQGSPKIVKNNHPLFAGVSAVVHNGCLYNDDFLFRELKVKREAETDSDIFRAIVDEFGFTDKGMEVLNRVSGSAAIAVFDPRYPGKMLIARSGSPLTIASDDKFFAFASEKHVLHRAMRPWVHRFGVDFQVQSLQMAFSPFPDDTMWMFGPNGREWHKKFDTLTGVYKKPNYQVNCGYEGRQKKWEREAAKETKTTSEVSEGKRSEGLVIVSQSAPKTTAPVKLLPEHVRCPSCGRHLKLNAEQRRMTIDKLYCPKTSGGCGEYLDAIPQVTVN